jgi:hypothetical protein
MQTRGYLTNRDFRFLNSLTSFPGQLLAQPIEDEGSTFNLNHVLYVNDGSFLFEPHKELNQGAVRLFDHFANSVEVQYGSYGLPSKQNSSTARV